MSNFEKICICFGEEQKFEVTIEDNFKQYCLCKIEYCLHEPCIVKWWNYIHRENKCRFNLSDFYLQKLGVKKFYCTRCENKKCHVCLKVHDCKEDGAIVVIRNSDNINPSHESH